MKAFLKKFLGQSGMSLVEVTIAAALAGGLALVIAQMGKNSGEVSKRADTKFSVNSLKGQIASRLSDSTACENTLGSTLTSANLANPNLTGATSGTGITLVNAGVTEKGSTNVWLSKTSKFGEVTLTDMRLRYVHVANQSGEFVATGTYKLSGKTVAIKPIIIPLNLNTISGGWGASSSCSAGGNFDNIWVAMSLGEGIEYAGGAVKVGTGTVGLAGGTVIAFASGTTNTATGANSAAFGSYGQATGLDSFVIGGGNAGLPNIASGTQSFAGGVDSQANAGYTFSFGVTNRANAYQSIVLGTNNTSISGATRSILIGSYLNSSNADSVTLGDGSSTILNNSVQNGFAARFAGGYRFFNDAAQTQSFKINTNGSISSGTSTASGSLSVAFGSGNTANNPGAIAMGTGSTATASTAGGVRTAIAIGHNAVASGEMAPIALGYFSQATGDGSFAIQGGLANNSNAFAGGGGSTASGMSSFAFGYNSSATNTASALTSFALGDSNTASGQASFAMGETNTVSGQDSFAMGNLNSVSGLYALAEGGQNNVSGNYGFTGGFLNNVTAEAGSAFGKGNIVTGVNAHATGEANLVTGISSMANGYYNTASNDYAVALGFYNTASGSSGIAVGNTSTASGSNSFAANGGVASGSTSVALANGNAAGSSSFAVMGTTGAYGNTVAIGTGSQAQAIQSLAIGSLAKTYGRYSLALGRLAITGINTSLDSTGNGYFATAIGSNANAVHNGSMVLAGQQGGTVINSSAANKLTMYFPGGAELCSVKDAGNICIDNGVRWIAGTTTWTFISDKNRKKNFQEIDGNYVLENFAKLDLSTWQYKTQENSDKKRHIGPMAQDFYHLFAKQFSFYSTDKMIVEGDVRGIVLVAIKELEKRTRDLASENEKLKSENKLLKEAVCEVNPSAKICGH